MSCNCTIYLKGFAKLGTDNVSQKTEDTVALEIYSEYKNICKSIINASV